jgi:drug/metabolite transporter (DMT)-like permease
MKKLLTIGPIFIVFAAFLWALDGLLRISLYSLPPAVVVFYEHVLGFIVLLFVSFKWFKDLKKMTRKEWIAISLVALFSGALGTIFYTAALQKVQFLPFSVVVLLQQQLQPIWVILTSAIILKEKISKKFLGWAALALVAVYFVTFKDLTVNFKTGSETLIAASLAIGAGLVWGSSTAFSKVVLKQVHFLTATAMRFFLAPIFALIFVFAQNQAGALAHVTTAQFEALLAITFSTGMVALVIYYYGLKRTSARVSAICELMFPLTAVFIDYFHFHNSLSITQILGALVLVFTIFQVSKLEISTAKAKLTKAA